MGIHQMLFGGAPSVPPVFNISNSLRLRASASAYFSRTPAAGNRKTWTLSLWVKRSAMANGQLFTAYVDGTNYTYAAFESDALRWSDTDGGVNTTLLITTQLFRDPSAWYHLLFVNDTSTASGQTADNRRRLYVNGVQVTSFSSRTNPAADYEGHWNKAVLHKLGVGIATYFDGYFAKNESVEGFKTGTTTANATDFGETNSDGVWVPKAYTGTYGTNGFHLDFKDASSVAALGLDSSGNANNWTPVNVSVTLGPAYDSMVDTPTNNFATLNPLMPIHQNIAASILGSANLTMASGSGVNAYGSYGSTIALSGKKAWEVYPLVLNASIGVGIAPSRSGTAASVPTPNVFLLGTTPNSSIYKDGVSVQSGLASIVAGDVVTCEFDADAFSIVFKKNGVAIGTPVTTPADEYVVFISAGTSAAGAGSSIGFGFGQAPLNAFAVYQAAFGGYSVYAPSAGFKALCTANLPAVTIAKPSDNFQVLLNTGAAIKGAMNALFSGSVFQWIKDRANSNNHQLADNSRGLSAILQSNTTAAETTYVTPAGNSVGWGWKTGGASVANNAGSIASQVSANITAGFSVVTYTGNGVAGATVGHGLGVAPKMMIVKNRATAGVDWPVYHASLANTGCVYLNTTAVFAVDATRWNNTSPNPTVFTVGTGQGVNQNTVGMLAYCFAEIPGFSKFEKYIGNGAVDGPFVHCGFRPRFVMIKRASVAIADWIMFDSARPGYNVIGGNVYPSAAFGEDTQARIDFTANGFKIRADGTSAAVNVSGSDYVYAAFAEHPFGGSNVSPSPAR